MAGPAYDDDYRDFESREAGDKNVFVKFYTKPVKNDTKSDQEGRPIFDEREYVEIRTPGNATNVVQRPVTDMDKQRFRRQYRAFKEDKEQQMPGTPLKEVPWITASQCEELAYLRIITLEQLSEVNDDVCGRIPGLFKLKERAKLTVSRAADNAPLLEMQTRLEEMKAMIEAQQQTIDDQSKIIKDLNSKK